MGKLSITALNLAYSFSRGVFRGGWVSLVRAILSSMLMPVVLLISAANFTGEAVDMMTCVEFLSDIFSAADQATAVWGSRR